MRNTYVHLCSPFVKGTILMERVLCVAGRLPLTSTGRNNNTCHCNRVCGVFITCAAFESVSIFVKEHPNQYKGTMDLMPKLSSRKRSLVNPSQLVPKAYC